MRHELFMPAALQVVQRLAVAALCFGQLAANNVHSAGQTIESDRWALELIVRQAQQATGVPGLAAALVDEDEIVAFASGLRAAAPAQASNLDPGDVFNIGSNFKAMTATIAARVVEQGKIGWDSTFADVYPEYQSNTSSDFKSVTLRQLLAHRGGMVDDEQSFEALSDLSGTGQEIRAQAVPIVLASTPGAQIGQFEYSNLGYAIAGAMLEKTSGKSFESLVQSELVDGLGMNSLVRGSPGGDLAGAISQPFGHNADGQPVTPHQEGFDDEIGLEPAGLYSVNFQDWAKFVRLHLGQQDATGYLDPSNLEILHNKVGSFVGEFDDFNIGYALGWETIESNSAKLLLHNGSNTFWYSAAILNPETGRAILLASNQAEPGAIAIDGLVQSLEAAQWLRGGPLVPEGSCVAVLVAIAAAGVYKRRSKLARQTL